MGGLFALLEGARCVITNDTGPMHMAWALGAPTVALFGPVDPNQYGWSSPRVQLLYQPVYCSPCVHEVDIPPCGGNNTCMQRIALNAVEDAVDRVLAVPIDSALEVHGIDTSIFVDQGSDSFERVVLGGVERWERIPTNQSNAGPTAIPCESTELSVVIHSNDAGYAGSRRSTRSPTIRPSRRSTSRSTTTPGDSSATRS